MRWPSRSVRGGGSARAPWLVGAQRRMVAVGRSAARVMAPAAPPVVLERGGPGALPQVVFAPAVMPAIVVIARLPRQLGGGVRPWRIVRAPVCVLVASRNGAAVTGSARGTFSPRIC